MYKELIDSKTKQANGAYIVGNILVPMLPLGLMTAGFIEMGNGKTDYGWNLFKAGAITLAAFEVTYQGGHFIFKWW